MLIDNPSDRSSSLIINLDKNTSKSPIYPGVKKLVWLAAGETKEFYYTP